MLRAARFEAKLGDFLLRGIRLEQGVVDILGKRKAAGNVKHGAVLPDASCEFNGRELSMETVHLFVSGRVQGVGFRYNTQRKARELGVKEVPKEGLIDEVILKVNPLLLGSGIPLLHDVDRHTAREAVVPFHCHGERHLPAGRQLDHRGEAAHRRRPACR